MLNTWFGRFLVFVAVLVALRVFFRWNISILGSIVVTLVVYGVVAALQKE